MEAALIGRGEEVLEGWAARGRVGSSKWPKHRSEVVSEERWAEMLKDLQDRQRGAMAKVKELRQQRKKLTASRESCGRGRDKEEGPGRASSSAAASIREYEKTTRATPGR